MKKIFALVLLLLITRYSFSQGYPISQNLGSDSTIVVSKGATQSRFVNIVYVDTQTANTQRIKNYPGAQIATNGGGIKLWLRNQTATAWIPVNTGSGNNIYTIDGTLTGNRTLTGGGYPLTFTGLDKFVVSADSLRFIAGDQALIFTGDSASLSRRLSYTSNLGSTFTQNSLVDKNYVDSLNNTSFPGGIQNYIAKFSGAKTIDTSQIYQNGQNVGIGTTTPNGRLAIVDTGGFALKINYNSASTVSDSNAAIYAENNGLSSYVAIFNEKTTNSTGAQLPLLIESSLTTGTPQANMGTGVDFGTRDDANNRKLNRFIIRGTDPAAATYTSRAEFRLWNAGSQTIPYYWLGNGNMGLGTSTPDSNLTVVNGALFGRGIRAPGLPQAPGTKALRIDASGTISYADTLIDAGGTVTSVATNDGTGITGGTITTSGTLAIDTLLISTRAWRQKGIDSVAALISSGYVPYTGATQNVDLGQFGLKTKYVEFDTSSQAVADRRLQWSNDEGTLQFGMTNGATITQRIGLEQFARVKNVQGSQINKGQAVYIYGASGDRASVKLADNRADSTSSKTLGVAAEDIPTNDVGLVGTFGVVSNLNLSSFNAGDILYLDSVPGQLTKTKPQAPYHLVFIGVVERANSGNGLLFVNPQNGYELEELHNVRITSPVLNNAILAYDSVARLWKDTTLNGIGGVTGSLISGYIPKATGANTIDTSQIFQSNGNIGIGTTSPTGVGGRILHINAGVDPEIHLTNSMSGGGATDGFSIKASSLNSYIYNYGGGLMEFGTNNTPRMRITSNGEVGIGTSSPDSLLTVNLGTHLKRGVRASGLPSAPGTKALRIDASGTISIADTLIDAGGTVTSVATNNGTGITGGTITTSGTIAADTLLLSTRAWRQKGIDSVAALINSNVSGTTNYVSKFTGTNTIGNSQIFDNATSVGIGTATPSGSYKLDVNGNINVSNAVNYSQGGTKYGWTYATTAAMAVEGLQGADISLGTGSGVVATEKMIIKNSGSVGIGTNTPDSLFTVAQGAHLQRGVRMSGLPTAAGTKSLRIDASGTLSVVDTGLYVPTSRTLTINGTTQDLTADRTWNVGTVTTAAATGGGQVAFFNGSTVLTSISTLYFDGVNKLAIGNSSPDSMLSVTQGAHIQRGVRLSGLPTAPGTKSLRVDANGTLSVADTLTNGISGSGTTNYIPKFTSSSAIGNSVIYDNGGEILINTTTDAGGYKLQVNGSVYAENEHAYYFKRTTGTPSDLYSWSADSGSGYLYNHTTSNVLITFLEGGNVGIGTTNPGTKLDVNGQIRTAVADGSAQLKLERTNSSTGSMYLGADNVGFKVFDGSFNTRLTLTSDGNLGLGVTPSAWANTRAAISIKNGAELTGYANGFELMANAYNDGNWKYIANSFASGYQSVNGGHFWYNAASGTAGNAISFTQAMTLDASGNLGIGTTSIVANDGTSKTLQLGTRLAIQNVIGTQFLLGTNAYYDGAWKYIAAAKSQAIRGTGESGTIQFHLSPTGTAGGTITNMDGSDIKMIILESGNVGIGTTSPSTTLDVVGVGKFSSTLNASHGIFNGSFLANETSKVGIGFASGYAEINSWGANTSTYGGIKLQLSASNGGTFTPLIILPSGNVGIGTTNPGAKLDVNGEVYVSPNTAGKNTFQLTTNASDDGRLKILSNTTTKVDIQANGTTYFNGGNVGIGTTNPAQLLHLATELATSSGVGTAIQIESGGAGGDQAWIGVNKGSGNGLEFSVENRDIIFNTGATTPFGGSERMRITSGGNVGIGTQSPRTVSGFTTLSLNNATNGGLIDFLNNGTLVGQIYNNSTSFDIGSITSVPLVFRTGDVERMRITAGGEVYIGNNPADQGAYNLQVNGTGVWGAGAYVDGSDSAVKKNIQPLGSSLDLIKQMNPVTFEYQPFYSKDTTTQTGFIAQELQQVLSDKVYKNGIVKEGGQYLGVAYQHLIPLLVKSIQELEAQVQALKTQLNNR